MHQNSHKEQISVLLCNKIGAPLIQRLDLTIEVSVGVLFRING